MASIQDIAGLLDASLDPRTNKDAERQLRALEPQQGFALSLLQLVASEAIPATTRLSGALYFKNFIGRNWTDEEGKHKLPDNEVLAIKNEIVGLMVAMPTPKLQSQLGEAVSIIANSDFYDRWDTLIDDLVSRLTTDNTKVNNGVLQVAHAIFKRWRPLYRSDDLFTEINHVLQKFAEPFLKLFESTDAFIASNEGNKEALVGYFQTLNNIVKISFDLNCQDLAPSFEENLTTIMGVFHKYLTYTNPLLETDDDEEAGLLERVKAGICELLQLFAEKYADVFDDLMQNFTNSVWTLLTNLGPQPKYDLLVSRALHFLTAVAKSHKHSQNFSSEQILGQVVEKIILPNVTMRESDEELFEDDPIEFIRRDLEGSDSDTRRRAATDFLRKLLEQFDRTVTDVVTEYINHYLQEFSKDKSKWRSKDTALYLFSAIAAKGSTERHGVVHVNLHVDVVKFFQEYVAEDLLAPFDAVHPILKVDAIKYIFTFRGQLTKEQLSAVFPKLSTHLGHSNYVVYTYTAVTIDRLLAMVKDRAPVFTSTDIAPYAGDLLKQLFRLVEQGGTPEKIAENEFLMRCVMRILILCGDKTADQAEFVMAELLKVMSLIAKNPSNPRFNHYCFESLGAIIRFVAPAQPAVLEEALYIPLMEILSSEVTEFIPYVFQLLALLLESNASAPLPQKYKDLVAPLLNHTLWEVRGNIPGLVRLLTVLMARGSPSFIESNNLIPVLGVFQKLVASKWSEVHAFELLEACILNFPMTALQPFMKDVFILLFTRLTQSKTENVARQFARLFHFLSGRKEQGAGPDWLVEMIQLVQPGVFDELYTSVVLRDTMKLQRPENRKIAVIGLTNFMTASEAFAGTYHQCWKPSAITLLRVLENSGVPPSENPLMELQTADIDEVSFGAAFARLNTCRKAPEDPFRDVQGDLKKWVGGRLKAVEARVGGWVQSELPEDAQGVLKGYMV